jgi:ParB-like chromosome segregation protein Spo0J
LTGKFKEELGMIIKTEQIDIDKIIIGVRARRDFGDIDGLARSISEIGLLQPIVVSSDSDDPLLVDGHRRIMAYKKLGLDKIPAVVISKYDTKTYGVSKLLQAEHDANVVRKDFTPSEAVYIAEKIKDWIETNKRIENNERGNLPREKEYEETELLRYTRENYNKDVHLESRDSEKVKKEDGEYKRTRDVVAKSVGMSYKTLEKAKAVVESAAKNPENADLVEKMDKSGKVDGAYKELQDRISDNVPKGKTVISKEIPDIAIETKSKIVSLIVKMPDGRKKKMGSISAEWFKNKNVLSWIVENVGLGIEEKDIVIHRQGNQVFVFDSDNVEELRNGIKYLVNRYSFSGSLMTVLAEDNQCNAKQD